MNADNNRKTLEERIELLLKENIDYGCLPNTAKRCLFKSGAEKLCEAYDWHIRAEILHRQAELMQDGMYFAYEVKIALFDADTGQTVAEGLGSCNSRERKYSKSNPYDVVNTVLKMAKKRALVDAVLNATASSDIFTQDMEEETNRDVPILYEENRKQSEQSEPPVSAKQIDFIEQLLSVKRISIEQARAELQKRYRTIDYKQLTRKQASEFIKVLQDRKSMSA